MTVHEDSDSEHFMKFTIPNGLGGVVAGIGYQGLKDLKKDLGVTVEMHRLVDDNTEVHVFGEKDNIVEATNQLMEKLMCSKQLERLFEFFEWTRCIPKVKEFVNLVGPEEASKPALRQLREGVQYQFLYQIGSFDNGEFEMKKGGFLTVLGVPWIKSVTKQLRGEKVFVDNYDLWLKVDGKFRNVNKCDDWEDQELWTDALVKAEKEDRIVYLTRKQPSESKTENRSNDEESEVHHDGPHKEEDKMRIVVVEGTSEQIGKILKEQLFSRRGQAVMLE